MFVTIIDKQAHAEAVEALPASVELYTSPLPLCALLGRGKRLMGEVVKRIGGEPPENPQWFIVDTRSQSSFVLWLTAFPGQTYARFHFQDRTEFHAWLVELAESLDKGLFVGAMLDRFRV